MRFLLLLFFPLSLFAQNVTNIQIGQKFSVGTNISNVISGGGGGGGDITSYLSNRWTFAEGSGTVANDSINGDTGNLQGTTTWTTPGNIEPHAISFPGTGTMGVSISTFIPIGTTFTIAAWVNTVGTGDAYQAILAVNTTAGLYLHNNKLDFAAPADHDDGTTVASGGWHHVAMVCTSGAIQYYVDGVATSSYASGGAAFNANTIGADAPGFASERFNGFMQDLRYYNRALTAANILTLKNFPGP